jgi:thiosulfate/3-mercaptopyruvate sulfurtransferase
MPWLINAAQLDKFRKNQKGVVVLDATMTLPENQDVKAAFLDRHVAGARLFDFEVFKDRSSGMPNLLTRDENIISQAVGALGITSEHKIIFYDNSPLHTSCRALWMFKVFGHNPELLYVLDGGIDAWEKYGGKMESGEPRGFSAKPYEVSFSSHHIRTLMQMKANLHHPREQVVDVRHPVRFAGGPESRPGLRAGHIPGSYSFPFFTMFEADGRWKPIEKIRKQLTGIGVNLQAPIITSCGGGTTAATLNFALDLMGHTDHSLYNGSWTEWGAEELYHGEESLSERPVVTSLDK